MVKSNTGVKKKNTTQTNKNNNKLIRPTNSNEINQKNRQRPKQQKQDNRESKGLLSKVLNDDGVKAISSLLPPFNRKKQSSKREVEISKKSSSKEPLKKPRENKLSETYQDEKVNPFLKSLPKSEERKKEEVRQSVRRRVPNNGKSQGKDKIFTNNNEPTTQRDVSRMKRNREFQYTQVKKPDNKKEEVINTEEMEIKSERVLGKRPVLETVKNLNDINFFGRVSLVSYFNAKESGKLDEREVRNEYRKNTETLRNQNSLKYYLFEVAKRNLEYSESKYDSILVQIDPKLKDELQTAIESKILSSYEITIVKQHKILTQMNVEPIVIRMKLKIL